MRLRWLLFKQGFKSMFKFKLQFIIIVILSFLSSFYLISTFNTNYLINNLYKDVISENAKDFDYEYTKNIGSSKSLSIDLKDIYIQMNDFVSNQYISITDENNNTKTAANFYLSDNGSDNSKSFISKAFSSSDWKLNFLSLFFSPTNTGDKETEQENWKNPAVSRETDAYASGLANDEDTTTDSNGNTNLVKLPRYAELGLDFAYLKVNKETAKIDYSPASLNAINSLDESANFSDKPTENNSDYFRRFVCLTVGTLWNSFMSELNSYQDSATVDISKLPLAFQYFLKNSDDRKELERVWNIVDYSNPDWNNLGWTRLNVNDNNDLYKTSPEGSQLYNNKIFAYFYTSFSSLAFEMINDMLNYEKNEWNLFLNQNSDEFNKIKNGTDIDDNLVKLYNEKNENGVLIVDNLIKKNGENYTYDDDLKTSYDKAAATQMIAVWQYLFGTKFGFDDSISKTSYFSSYQNNVDDAESSFTQKTNSRYLINSNSNYLQNMDSSNLPATSALPNVNKDGVGSLDLYYSGLRGMTNPIIYNFKKDSSSTFVNSLKLNNNYEMLGRYDYQKTFASSRGGVDYSYDDIDLTTRYNSLSNRSSTELKRGTMIAEKYHQDMAGYLTGIDYSLREEGNLYDSNSKKTYRFVIIDENEIAKKNQYIKVIEGTLPESENEILINEQFAVENNITIGKLMNIGGVWRTVSGYATDSLSYYPIADLSTSIPNVKDSGIVYLSKKAFKNLSSLAGFSQILTMNNYNFLTRSKGMSDEDMLTATKTFNALINTNIQNMNISSSILANKNLSPYWSSDNWKNGNDVETLSSTPFAKNWTIQPIFSRALKLVTIIVSAVILLIAIIAIGYAIRKNIEVSAAQIAYMKAMGIKSRELAFSYVGYSFIIGFVITPISWLVGGMFQEVITRMFMQYIATSLYQFVFNWESLFLLSLLMWFISFAFSIFLAIFYNKSHISKIINGAGTLKLKYKEKKSNSIFNKLSFNKRFNIRLASRGRKPIIFLSLTTMFLTILITVFSFIPSMFQKYISDSETFFEYKNSYLMDSPFSNSPLSSMGVDTWDGINNLEKESNIQSFEGTKFEKYIQNYYQDYSKYSSSNQETNFLSKYKLNSIAKTPEEFNSNVLWTSQYLFENGSSSEDSSTSQNSFITLIVNSLLSRMAGATSFSLSTGDLEQIGLTPIYTVKNTNNTGDDFIGESDRATALSDTFAMLQDGLPTLLKTLMGTDTTIPKVDDWRKTLLYFLQTKMPSSISNYLTNDVRTSQFSISVGSENYVPGQETLGTVLGIKDYKNNAFDVEGLKSNQKVYNLKNVNTDDVFLDDETLKALNTLFDDKILNTDAIKQNAISKLVAKKIYDKDTETIYVPVIVNKTVNKTFDFKEPSITTESKYLKLNTDNGQNSYVIPKGAWIYDDRDYKAFMGSEYSDEDQLEEYDAKNNKISGFLDPFNLDSSKFVYENQYSASDKSTNSSVFMNKNTSVFSRLENNDGTLKYNIRPDYNFNNIRLYIPKKLISDKIEKIINMSSVSKDKIIKNDNDPLCNQSNWYGIVKSDSVPSTIKNSWLNQGYDNANNEDYYLIDPYNFSYSSSYNSVSDSRYGEVSISDLLKENLYNFGTENISLSENSIINETEGITQYNSLIKKVNFKKADVLKTYNDNVIIADQDLTNLLMGYNTNKGISMNYKIFKDSGNTYKLSNGNTLKSYNYNTLDDLKNADPSTLVYGSDTLFNSNSQQALKYSTYNRWFNKKYSKFIEPVGVTTGIHASLQNQVGFVQSKDFYLLLSNFSSGYKEINLSSTRVGIIVSFASVILSVCIFAISGIVIIATLFMMIMADSFISRYSRFILVMKSLGYSKRNILRSVLSIQSILNLFMIALGVTLGDLIIIKLLKLLNNLFSFDVPYVVLWWMPILVIGIILLAFIFCFSISLSKTLNAKPTLLLKD